MKRKYEHSKAPIRDKGHAYPPRTESFIQAAPLVKHAVGGSLADIADRIGVRARTLRSWMSDPYNLLRGEGMRGRAATYSPAFERRARFIAERLKENRRLSEVALELAKLTDDDIELRLSWLAQPQVKSEESAAEYAARQRRSASEPSHAPGWGRSSSGWGEPIPAGSGGSREVWEKFPILDGIELRVRPPVSSRLRSRLHHFLAEARLKLREP
jgi:hypothetical protein